MSSSSDCECFHLLNLKTLRLYFQSSVVSHLNLLENFNFKLFVSSGGSISLRGCADGCIFSPSDCWTPLCELLFFNFSTFPCRAPLYGAEIIGVGEGSLASALEPGFLLASLVLGSESQEKKAQLICRFSLSSKCLRVRLAPGCTLQLKAEVLSPNEAGAQKMETPGGGPFSPLIPTTVVSFLLP